MSWCRARWEGHGGNIQAESRPAEARGYEWWDNSGAGRGQAGPRRPLRSHSRELGPSPGHPTSHMSLSIAALGRTGLLSTSTCCYGTPTSRYPNSGVHRGVPTWALHACPTPAEPLSPAPVKVPTAKCSPGPRKGPWPLGWPDGVSEQ